VKKFLIYTDGGSRGNPGRAAVGVVICNEAGQVIKKYGEYLGDNLTNNEAEYEAVIFALKKFKSLFGKTLSENTDIEMRSDSEFLVKQMNGEYKILDKKIQKLFIEAWNLRLDFRNIKFKHIGREKNTVADQLVNETLNSQSTTKQLI
jgi:ribonuclease HI